MNPDLPGNSHKQQSQPKAEEKADEPVIEPLQLGKVRRSKPSLLRRVRQALFTGDPNSVVGYLVRDVLIPAGQNLLTDLTRQGIEKMVYGEVRSGSRTYPNRGIYHPQQPQHISYNQASQVSRPSGAIHPMQSPQAQQRQVGRGGLLQIPNVIVDTRDDAQLILDYLFDIMRKYGIVTVANLNSALNQTGPYTDQYWGWTDLDKATYRRVADGYEVIFPSAEDLRQ